MKPKTVFTKADVIVTICCIVFLLATIGAVGPGGQRHAKEMLCLSQLHKWGEVFQGYLNDNGGYFMKGYAYDDNYASDYWMEALRPYYKKGEMRVCPEATVPGSEIIGSEYGGVGVFVAWGAFGGDECGEPSPSWPPATACDYGSYGMNGWVCNSPSNVPWGRPLPYHFWRVANVAGADNIPLLLDGQWIDGWPEHYDTPPEYDGQPWSYIDQMGRFCMNRHRGYINSLFLDGSARKVGLKELWTLKWHREYDTCSIWTACGGVMPNDWPAWMQDFEDY